MDLLGRFLSVAALSVVAGLAWADDFPPVSHDGLHLVPDTKVRAVYMKPGADLGEYQSIALLEVYVAFRKNWERDHNRDAADFEDRVTDKDMQRIREQLAQEFEKIFVDELSTRGGHKMVAEGGTGVLIIRPAIINLEVTAPDRMTAGMSRTFVTSAGQMTLYMELYDGATGDIIARIVDPRAADDSRMQWSNSVTNRAEADRIMRRWAQLLNDHLGAAAPGAAQQ